MTWVVVAEVNGRLDVVAYGIADDPEQALRRSGDILRNSWPDGIAIAGPDDPPHVGRYDTETGLVDWSSALRMEDRT